MTWNGSEEALKESLEKANTWHANIKLDYKIGKSLPFLDVLLTNENGTLATSVYHKPAAEPYLTPFISDHPRHVFGNIIQTALTRAVRYSSTFRTFQNEQRNIKLMLLYNGFVMKLIQYKKLLLFLIYISAIGTLPHLLPINSKSSSQNTKLRHPTCLSLMMRSNTSFSTINCLANSLFVSPN